MKTQYTEGPWYSKPTAGHEKHGQSAVISEVNGKTVAVVYDGQSDARLIAAAPELLAALINCSDYLSEFLEEGRAHRVIKKADQIIAKIERRSHE